MTADDDAPTLTAWIDGDDDPQLHVRVKQNGTVYESADRDLNMLLNREGYSDEIAYSALSLLVLNNRGQEDVDEPTPDDGQIEAEAGEG